MGQASFGAVGKWGRPFFGARALFAKKLQVMRTFRRHREVLWQAMRNLRDLHTHEYFVIAKHSAWMTTVASRSEVETVC
jgi:hypothetical protein